MSGGPASGTTMAQDQTQSAQFSKDSLDRIFNARSIAVVGASTDHTKPGHEILKNLVAMHYEGKVYPINPNAESILKFKCYASLMEIDAPIELVVFVLPPDVTLQIIQDELLERKKKFNDTAGVVIVGGGFRETGTAEGRDREKRLKELLGPAGIRIIGPNCQGIVNTTSKVNTTFDIGDYRKGALSVVTQSGALGCSFLMWAQAKDFVGLDRFISFGNMSDVDVAELLEYLSELPTTRVIWVYMEGYTQGPRFMAAARKASARKLVVVLKPGRTKLGMTAALSHTGSIAGEDEIWEAVFRQTGLIRAHSLEEFYDTSRAFEKVPLIKGNRIAVVTVCGGLGTLCIEQIAASQHVTMASFSEATRSKLAEILSPSASVGKPDGYIDSTGAVTEQTHFDMIQTVLQDQGNDGVIFLTTPPAFLPQRGWAEQLARAYQAQSADSKKPLLAVLGFGDSAAQSREVLEAQGIPVYEYPESAARVMENLVRYCKHRKTK
jgi:acetate---CoA ligase (ADP-forming)